MFKILSYGYDVEDEINGIATREEAENTLQACVIRWCDKVGINIDDTTYDEGDDYFSHVIDEKGVGAYAVFEYPDNCTEVEKLIYDAKIQLMFADFAADDYKATLCDCNVDYHTGEADRFLDEALELMKSQH